MYTLEEHIDTEYRDHQAHLQMVTRLVRRTLRIFANEEIFDSEGGGGWVYELKTDGTPEWKGYSFSTNAMITWALEVLESRVGSDALAPVPLARHLIESFWKEEDDGRGRESEYRSAIRQNAATGITQLIARLEKRVGQPCLTTSDTFGDNDPLTLAWILDLLDPKPGTPAGGYGTVGNPKLWKRVCDIAREEVGWIHSHLLGKAPGPEGRGERGRGGDRPDDDCGIRARDRALDNGRFRNAFWVLRYAHLAQMLSDLQDDKPPTLGRAAQPFFEERFHEHLAAVGTTAFDPAELVFALEGLVRWAPQPPRPQILERVFETLRQALATSAYWRPTRPVVTTPRGEVLFPLSVEVASSLLRTIYWLDRKDLRQQAFHSNLVLFADYVSWLESQVAKVETFDKRSREWLGWHSEYDPSRDAIHTWQTSQVLAFLAQFAALLQLNIERRLREAGRFHVSHRGTRDPVKGEQERLQQIRRWDTWLVGNEPIRPSGAVLSTLPDNYDPDLARDPWPNGSPASKYEILRQIRRDFVVPTAVAKDKKPDNFSFALYGPPGTGKTTQAQELANALGLTLIKLTTSDFVMGGEGEVEARAKAIFDALKEQSSAIIFFDELDRLLLDRTSRGYAAQSDLFQFMTPGMLTKLQDLRDSERCIFALATNHHERIDSAIKRAGRVDHQYLLLPPNHAQRVVWLEGFLRKGARKGIEFRKEPLRHAVAKAAAYTPWAVWNELRQITRGAANRSDTATAIQDALIEDAKAFRPAITLYRYSSSFKHLMEPADFLWNQEPWEEVLMLIYLLAERGGPDDPKLPTGEPQFTREMRWIAQFVEQVDWKEDGLPEIKDDTIRAALEVVLDEVTSSP